jgi:putative ABC transport system permease protein
MHPLRYVLRRLARTATGSLLVTASLGLAVGGAGSLLSVFNALVVRTMRVPESQRLVAVYPANGNARYLIPAPTLVELTRRQTVFDQVCGLSLGALQVELGGTLSRHESESLTGTCYQMMGLHPFLGRLIDARDAPLQGASPRVVVISYRFWRSDLAGDPDVIGKTLTVQTVPLTIIGVTPAGVGGFDADQAPDVVVSLGLQAELIGGQIPSAIYVIGRLRDGVALTQAAAEMRAMWTNVWASTNPVPAGQRPSRAGTLEALRVESIARGMSRVRDTYAEPIVFLLILAGLLVALACVNVGGFLLARVNARQRELAIMAAIGARLSRLLLDVALEGLLLGAGACAIAIPVAWATSRLFNTLTWTGSLPTSLETTPDAWVFLAIGAAAAAAGVGISLPALAFVRFAHASVSSGLARNETRTASRWRRALIVGQVGLSTVLVFAAGLVARNLESLRELNPGYQPSSLLWTKLELPLGKPRTIDQAAYYRPLLAQLAAVPGITGVALSSTFPSTQLYQVVGLTPVRRVGAEPGVADVSGMFDYISPGFFSTVGVPLDAGRECDWTDVVGHPPVVIINRALQTRLFPTGDAVGARIQMGTSAEATIVGVVPDVSSGDFRLRDLPEFYSCAFQSPQYVNAAVLVLRTSGPNPSSTAVKQVIESAGRHHVPWVRTIAEEMNLFWRREQALASVASAFGTLSLLISGLGLYALLHQTVNARQRELGVRMALGASGSRLLLMVLRDGARLALIGAAVGIPLALAAGRAAKALLSGLLPYDVRSIEIALAVLTATALLATLRPALSAARTRPSDALRAE